MNKNLGLVIPLNEILRKTLYINEHELFKIEFFKLVGNTLQNQKNINFYKDHIIFRYKFNCETEKTSQEFSTHLTSKFGVNVENVIPSIVFIIKEKEEYSESLKRQKYTPTQYKWDFFINYEKEPSSISVDEVHSFNSYKYKYNTRLKGNITILYREDYEHTCIVYLKISNIKPLQ